MKQYEIRRSANLNELKMPEVLAFGSKAEYATGALLEKYIPNFTLIPSLTMQIPLGINNYCDFKVENVYLEYHPTNLHFEFDDRQALRQFRNAMRHVKKNFREQIYDAIKKEMGEKYFRRRKMMVKMWGGQDAELVVVQGPEDLYRQVIKRFGSNYPKERQFVNEFNALRDSSVR